ncbi:HD domain-containing protein [Shinella sp.]|uniref:HD domain-containing protein n=1 Tax=Shinella sp. TaxID=1870904 RepID=UPI003F72D50E
MTDTLDIIRVNVREELPELGEITNVELRDKVVEAWAYALSREGMSRISDMEGSGAPGYWILTKGTQLDHIRGVTRLAIRYGDELLSMYPDLPLNRDVLIAGALIHDVGKPLEYNPTKMADWSARPHEAGWPVTRHPVHGWHVCLTVGLPENIAHIAAAHSREGDTIVRSMECTVIQACDHALWQVLRLGGMIKDGEPRYHPNPSARD